MGQGGARARRGACARRFRRAARAAACRGARHDRTRRILAAGRPHAATVDTGERHAHGCAVLAAGRRRRAGRHGLGRRLLPRSRSCDRRRGSQPGQCRHGIRRRLSRAPRREQQPATRGSEHHSLTRAPERKPRIRCAQHHARASRRDQRARLLRQRSLRRLPRSQLAASRGERQCRARQRARSASCHSAERWRQQQSAAGFISECRRQCAARLFLARQQRRQREQRAPCAGARTRARLIDRGIRSRRQLSNRPLRPLRVRRSVL
jgi:hypothetical protein